MKVSLSYALKTWGMHAILAVLCVLFIANIGANVLATVLNVVLLLLFGFLMYNDGAYNGEKACTKAAALEKHLKEGRAVLDIERQYVFSKKTAVVALVISLLPFLVLSAVNMAVAPLYPVEDQAAVVEEEEEIEEDPFAYNPEAAEKVQINVVNVITRLVFMPFVFTYSMVSGSVLNGLFFLYSFFFPLCSFAGYLSGPSVRKKKLKDIALGKKRKMRNLKVHKGPKQPKAEV